jgi:hypothetical protein
MRTLILSSIAVMSLALEQVGPAAAAAPASGDACALLTGADASALVGKPGKATPGTVSGVGQDAVLQTEFHLLWVLKNKKVAVVGMVRGFNNQDDLEHAKAAAIKIATKL